MKHYLKHDIFKSNFNLLMLQELSQLLKVTCKANGFTNENMEGLTLSFKDNTADKDNGHLIINDFPKYK